MLKNLKARLLKGEKKGFTLVELIIVIVILVILAAIAVPSVATYIQRANKGKVQANARSVYMAVTVEIADQIRQNPTAPVFTGVAAAAKATANVPGTITTLAITPITGEISGTTFVYEEAPYTATLTLATGVWTITP